MEIKTDNISLLVKTILEKLAILEANSASSTIFFEEKQPANIKCYKKANDSETGKHIH